MHTLPTSLTVHDKLVAGTEPAAVVGSDVGVLLLHGYTGSPWELRPLADHLIERGYSVAMPVLAGHGTAVADLEFTAWNDWLASAGSALTWLQARTQEVHIVGLSMGALLALVLARSAARGSPRSLTLMAPALTLKAVDAVGITLADSLGWPKRFGKSPPELLAGLLPPAYWQIPVGPTTSLMEMIRVVRATATAPGCPTLVLHGSRDRTIPMKRARRIARRILPGAQHVVVRGAGHLLPQTRQRREVIDRVYRFIGAHSFGGAPGGARLG